MPAARTPHCSYALTRHLHAEASDIPSLWSCAVPEPQYQTTEHLLNTLTQMADISNWTCPDWTQGLHSQTSGPPGLPRLSTRVQMSPATCLRPFPRPAPPPGPAPHAAGLWHRSFAGGPPTKLGFSPSGRCGVRINLAPTRSHQVLNLQHFSAPHPGDDERGQLYRGCGQRDPRDASHHAQSSESSPHVTT